MRRSVYRRAAAGCRRSFSPTRPVAVGSLCTWNVLHDYCAIRADTYNRNMNSMTGKNITIHVDADLAREAKVLAARRGTSLSRLVAEQLEVLVRGEQTHSAARRRALARLRHGCDLGGGRPLSRDEAHDRKGRTTSVVRS